MIQANELRVGNYIFDDDKYLAEVRSISDLNEKEYGDEAKQLLLNLYKNGKWDGHFECAWTDCNPIPLTGEWLLKLGFNKIREWTYEIETSSAPIRILLNSNGIANIYDGTLFGEEPSPIKASYGFSRLDIEVDSIHKLQNICFSLKGLELTTTK